VATVQVVTVSTPYELVVPEPNPTSAPAKTKSESGVCRRKSLIAEGPAKEHANHLAIFALVNREQPLSMVFTGQRTPSAVVFRSVGQWDPASVSELVKRIFHDREALCCSLQDGSSLDSLCSSAESREVWTVEVIKR
jgi:hypothetical protein